MDQIKTSRRLEPILLVEDDPDHARLVQKAFSQHGHLANDIIWVKNGIEAINYIYQTDPFTPETASTPGLILLDIKMPMKDGFQVLEELKSHSIYKTIPVVVLTTTSNIDDVERALKLGANDYIVKPVKFVDFVEKIGQLGHYWAFISDANLGALKS